MAESLRSARRRTLHKGVHGPTKDQLYTDASKKNIDGRSSMNKEQLRKALGR
ncbi:hypothetical protein SFIMM107S_04089 [Streptomyces griseus]